MGKQNKGIQQGEPVVQAQPKQQAPGGFAWGDIPHSAAAPLLGAPELY